ncbi:MAG: RNA-directed DNA polymerase [Muribaculaceae bacterium]|nr:RNA-directed DNA polymerase [Muribaculaceae bacterium]
MEKRYLTEKAQALNTTVDLFNLLNEIKCDILGDNSFPFKWNRFLALSTPGDYLHRYYSFKIPKKSGGFRSIYAPLYNLRWIQICLNEIFKAIYTPSPYAMGFAAGRSIVDNARMHTNQNYVFNIDLQDFFHSIDRHRVYKRLQFAPFNFNPEIANVIAGFCTIKSFVRSGGSSSIDCYVLPQGAPTSPLLTNAICDTLDRRLQGLAKRFGLHYSRYADDITFSSMHNVYQEQSEFRQELERIIADQGFTINPKKTRLSHCSKRQEVTGLVVSQKVNVNPKFVKDIRAILHIWEKYGYNAAYSSFYPKYLSEKCQLNRGYMNLANVISGKLCFLKMVKGAKDPIYIKLNEQFASILKSQKSTKGESERIKYLMTMTKRDFEKKIGTKIHFNRSRYDAKIYGYFYYHGKSFLVAVSQNLDITNLPDETQISLCEFVKYLDCEYDSDPRKLKSSQRYYGVVYLLHKPHYGLNMKNKKIPKQVKEMVINFANRFPELELKDEFGIIDEYNKTQIDKN